MISEEEKSEERRQQTGSRFWVGLNLLLFPIPSHFALLRARDFSLKKSFLHLGMTAVLLAVLAGAALLQILFPTIGRLWMILPILSGILVAVLNRRTIAQFQPMQSVSLDRRQAVALLLFLIVLTVIHILPEVDLIELQHGQAETSTEWMRELPLWQSAVILAIGTLIVLAGYVTGTTAVFSLNRIIILYACFIVIASQIGIILLFACRWLHLTGGFPMELTAVSLAAVLALDYRDATTFGQFTRRYALLTCTKGLSFLFLWLCFLGLPQKTASAYLSYYHNQAKFLPMEIPYDSLIFTDRDRFENGHKALSRLRKLFAESLLGNRPEMAGRIIRIMQGQEAQLLPAGDDVWRLKELLEAGTFPNTALSTGEIPFFRPVAGAWDVFMTALIRQGDLSAADVSEIIAGFKALLPKSSEGHLPELDSTYDIHYVAMATGAALDFLPPTMPNIEWLLARKRIPVLALPFSGETRWGALLVIDKPAGIAWFRVATDNAMEKAIQAHFDASSSGRHREVILTHLMVPMALTHLEAIVPHIGEPIAVLGKEGLGADLPEGLTGRALEDIRQSMSLVSRAQRSLESISGQTIPEPGSDYARYMRSLVRLYDLISPKNLDFNLLPDPKRFNSAESWPSRLQQAEDLVRAMGGLRDMDRIPMVRYLLDNKLAQSAPGLFMRLAAPAPVSSNMVGCGDAFDIGRRLFLMGHYQEAMDYFVIAHNRHPYDSAYEIWYHLARLKLQRDLPDFRSLPERQPGPWLYYRTLLDIREGKSATARKRLEKAVERDSHDCMANHLLETYFQKPLDERYFFPSPEGL
ncbi:MAG: hypothetical protein ACOZF0_07045 [Thermodesulfobacteriota bacterium]